MAERILQIDDINFANNPAQVSAMFRKLGYSTLGQAISVTDLGLSPQSSAAIYEVHLIADQTSRNRSLPDLQVLLITLKPEIWEFASVASGRMKAIAICLAKNKPDNYLLIGTNQQHDYLLLINPRKSLDTQGNVKVNIHKLLIDRANPTAHDRERLDAITVRHLDPQQLYKAHCEAFDVEKLTKRFYNEYRQLFERVQQVIKEHSSHSYFEDAARLHQFSQRLLGRIMFLYFLQKKEFLAGDRRFLSHQYDRLKSQPEETNYYSDILEPLFFEILNQDRPGQNSPWGKIPYLNGGLFDRDYGENIKDGAGRETPSTITLPNFLFDPNEKNSNSVLGFFNSYNFIISENIPGDEDVAVDPEMLGKVFENMLEAGERGKSGTFYTPRGIVNFMCVEVLSRYLAKETGINLEAIQGLIELDLDLSDGEDYGGDLHQKITPTQAKELKRAIASVKILDPAVGSGAFPLGMMQVILAVRQAVELRESGRTIRRGSLTISNWKREIIANNLYGVDIKPEAIEVAKLRMWLSLVVDIPTIEDVEALPNLDYKLMCGDSLISTINGEQLIPDPTKTQQTVLAFMPIQAAIQPLLELQHRYYEAQSAERVLLRQQILDIEKEVFRVSIQQNKSVWIAEQKLLEDNIRRMGKTSKPQTKRLTEISAKISELDAFEMQVESGERSLNFFQYHLHFRDVFEAKGGFDIVVGNPPYVSNEKFNELKPALEKEFDCYTARADIFVYFFERGFRLLKNGGHLTYITPNKYFRSGYGEKLRKFLGEQATIQTLIDFGDAAVFEAIAYPSIIVFSKVKPEEKQQVRLLNWEPGQSVDKVDFVYGKNSFLIPQKELTVDGWQLEPTNILRLWEKIRARGLPLIKYVDGQLYRGITTGFNEAFVIDKEDKTILTSEDSLSSEILKPFLEGKDVKRWDVNYQDLYLIFTYRGIDIDRYPSVKKYLIKHESRLTPGVEKGRAAGNYKWFELQASPKDSLRFESPKIIIPTITQRMECYLDNDGIPTITQRMECYLDNDGYFCNDKASVCISDDNSYLIGILNSSISNWFVKHIAASRRGGFFEFKPIYISQIPIPNATEPEKEAIAILVGYVLYLTAALKDIPSQGKVLRESSMDKLMNSYFEQIIDALVTELYLPEELHEYDRYFMRYILIENLPNLDQIKGDKMAGLRVIFERLFDKDHPLRIGIFFLDSVPAIRVIRGLK